MLRVRSTIKTSETASAKRSLKIRGSQQLDGNRFRLSRAFADLLIEPYTLTLDELFDVFGAIRNVNKYFARPVVSSNESKTSFAVVEFDRMQASSFRPSFCLKVSCSAAARNLSRSRHTNGHGREYCNDSAKCGQVHHHDMPMFAVSRSLLRIVSRRPCQEIELAFLPCRSCLQTLAIRSRVFVTAPSLRARSIKIDRVVAGQHAA
jgi:hypothetical protein